MPLRFRREQLSAQDVAAAPPRSEERTSESVMIVSGTGKIGGREAMRRWYREAFATEPMRSLAYPVEWYMIDECGVTNSA